jgi:hypothetical protein
LFLRFSIVAADEGAPDTDRDVRGVAIKFYNNYSRVVGMPRLSGLHHRYDLAA